ncbi:uncharacterized protein LOC128181373 [Crassostrea angulata]|uniref:uncharacterized protein LOC128181373 n=1 Tax=Magallana angulata TaxID=2784310 RepID=UPI0022B0F708|nr:uncharacterized protein LOC128181373 [Crassostrea angulata]
MTMSISLVICSLFGIVRLNAQTLGGAVCQDKIDNCSQYGLTVCTTYQPWARDHCSAYCGFCIAPSTTPLPCADKIDDCESYGQHVCSEPRYIAFVLENCRYFCRQCSDEQLANADSKTTTLPPPLCVDKLDTCVRYSQDVCTTYKRWAQENCRFYCRLCSQEQLLIADSKTTTTTTIGTPAIPCKDNLPHCDVYGDDICTTYPSWAEVNCRAYCRFCKPLEFVTLGSVGPGSIPVNKRTKERKNRSYLRKLN